MKKITKPLVLAGIAALTMGLAVQAMPRTNTKAATTTVVTPSNLQGWEKSSQATSSGTFVEGPQTPPLGTGSYQMATGPGSATQGGKEFLYNTSYFGQKLTDFTALSYSTYTSAATSSAVAPSLNIASLTTGTTNWTTFVYEPVYSTDQQSVAQNTWQNWNALEGNWWSTRDLRDAAGTLLLCNPNGTSANTPECAGKLFVPWSYITTNFPQAVVTMSSQTIGGVQIVVGQNGVGAPWNDYMGNIDNVIVNNTTFDFELTVTPSPTSTPTLEPTATPTNTPIPTSTPLPTLTPTALPTATPAQQFPTSKEQCKDNGWRTFTVNFKNQGECVSSIASKGKARG